MANQLSIRDRELLNTGMDRIVGNPESGRYYENGKFGTQPFDFAFFELYDSANNLLEYKNLSAPVENTDSSLYIYPANHITDCGYESGIFKVRYQFLRKLAGDDSTVLIRTNANHIGEIYDNIASIYITDDGKVFIGTQEEFEESDGQLERLILEDYKYQIQEISSTRTEVRLQAKDIKGAYQEEFAALQESIRHEEIFGSIEFQGPANTNNQIVIDTDGELVLTSKMIGGTFTIPDVYKLGENITEVKTEFNIVNNGDGEMLQTNSNGDVYTSDDLYGWNGTLHYNAVYPIGWTPGYFNFNNPENDFNGTHDVGYHAHWAQNEGKNGGVCMKFPDMNADFIVDENWPPNQPNRMLRIDTREGFLPTLQSQGVTTGDKVNVSFDIKNSAPGKGVRVAMRFSHLDAVEEIPGYPLILDLSQQFPSGYPPFLEEIPALPPEGYEEPSGWDGNNTVANALVIEPRPPDGDGIAVTYAEAGNHTLTESTHWPGQINTNGVFAELLYMTEGYPSSSPAAHGAWRVSVWHYGTNEILWTPNLIDSNGNNTFAPHQLAAFWGAVDTGISMDGEISPEGQWIWHDHGTGTAPGWFNQNGYDPANWEDRDDGWSVVPIDPSEVKPSGIPAEYLAWHPDSTEDGGDVGVWYSPEYQWYYSSEYGDWFPVVHAPSYETWDNLLTVLNIEGLTIPVVNPSTGEDISLDTIRYGGTNEAFVTEAGQWVWRSSTGAPDSPPIPEGNWIDVDVYAESTIRIGPASCPWQEVVSTVVGSWERKDVSFTVPVEWRKDLPWNIVFYGHTLAQETQGVTWVDNVYCDVTYTAQTTVKDVMLPYTSTITDVSDNNSITVAKSFDDVKNEIYGDPIVNSHATINNTSPYDTGNISYTINNPFDLRTYLKFDNNFFLTTNFRADKINVSKYPYSIVYKLYEPLPDSYKKFDECSIVKEMADPYEDNVQIVDFIDTEITNTVLKSPDLFNVESPIQRRVTPYKTEIDILTDDDTISDKLRDEFLSQSFESVELNTDYNRYENFINFSSAKKRLENFKYKLQLIETYSVNSSSYQGISGSADDIKLWKNNIKDVKNEFDPFEKYMYVKSSSFTSGSLGIFYDNAWPKTSGNGTVENPYIIAHTTSSQAITWFINAQSSASVYDLENFNKLSTNLPSYIKENTSNQVYLDFTDMIGQHFDSIWEYVNSITEVFDRRQKLDEGISKELLYTVAKSLGWDMPNAKDLVDLPRYALGSEVTGSLFSTYSAIADRDISREIWSRIIANMPFFLKNKGTIRALKGLINVYGIPSTILRVKEYGGPDLPDASTPQFEITRKFTKALDFRGAQSVMTTWADDGSTNRKSDTVEFRFRAVTGSDQILLQKEDNNDQDWFIRLKDNGSSDNYGNVSFMLSGSKVGVDAGEYKEISSSALPVYDGDFYSVMVRRTSGSDNINVSQSYELHVGKYDSGRSKIHLYSTTTMDVTQSPSASFSHAWTGSGDVYIGGKEDVADVGVQFSGSIMEYRHWTETLNTGSFKNHIGNPKAYNGNSISSSYENLVLRYSFNDNKDLSTDTEGIRDVSANQTTTYSGSHSGFSGNFFSNVVDELKTHIPSIGALRRTSNKIRVENDNMKPGHILSATSRATRAAYDTAPLDSNKVGIFFAPTDVINNDIINSIADLKFDDYLGDPRDLTEYNYRGLDYVANNYWKKYNSPNNFWDYIRLLKYYDQSLFPQLKKMVPARAKSRVGVLIEPNIFERPKTIKGKKPSAENLIYTSSLNYGEHIAITSSYNNSKHVVTNYDDFNDTITIFTYSTGSLLTITGSNLLYEGSSSQAADMFIDKTMWSRLNTADEFYATASITFGDFKYLEVLQPVITGSRIYGNNQKLNKFYSSSYSHSYDLAYSSSWYNVDLDNLFEQRTALSNMFYNGVKNTRSTTLDGGEPIEYVITAPTKLVPQEGGDSNLKTGHGLVSQFVTSGKVSGIERLIELEEGLISLEESDDDTTEDPPAVPGEDTLTLDPDTPRDPTDIVEEDPNSSLPPA